MYEQTCYIDLKTNLQLQIQLDIQSGERVEFDLQTNPIISLTKIYDGSNLYSIVKDAQPVQLGTVNIYEGQTTNCGIIISQAMTLQFLQGSIGYLTLKDNLATPLNLNNIYAGDNLSSQIRINQSLTFDYRSGEVGYFDDLIYVINQGTQLDYYEGGELNIDQLILYPSIPIKFDSENYVELALSTSYILPLNKIGGGETCKATIDVSPPPIFEFANSEGSRLTHNMYFRARLGIFQFVGSTFKFDIHIPTSPPLEFNAYCGQSCTIWLPEIKLNSVIAGEFVKILSISTEPLWWYRTGETLTTSGLRTATIISGLIQTDSHCSIELSVKHSEGIGLFKAFEGVYSGTHLQTMLTQSLSILFEHDLWTQLDIDSTTYFDLTTDLCCGARPLNGQNSYIIELDNAEYPEEVFYGNNIKYSVELSTNSSLQIQFYPDDYNLSLIDRSDYLSVDFHSGEILDIISFESILRIRLCKGYFIPSGDSVITEFTDVITEDCYSDIGYMGESLSCKLLHNPCFKPKTNEYGSTFEFDIVLDSPWELKAYAGESLHIPEYVRISTFEPTFNCYSGSHLSTSFPPPVWRGYAGEAVTCSITTTKITIDFVDAGCLQNEFQFKDNFGNIIPEKYMPVAIELYPFEHQLKLKPRCVF